jgi:hypothetical protein
MMLYERVYVALPLPMQSTAAMTPTPCGKDHVVGRAGKSNSNNNQKKKVERETTWSAASVTSFCAASAKVGFASVQ